MGNSAISLIDHTSLNATDSVDSVQKFVRAILGGPLPAGICVYPKFVGTVVSVKQQEPELFNVRVAATANFPLGQDDIFDIKAEVRQAIADGADEIDLVINYKLFHEDVVNAKRDAELLVSTIHAICPPQVLLKVILETGELAKPELIKEASQAALAGGADFLKTSTGKVPVNATPEAVLIMAQEINVFRKAHPGAKPVGIKVAGGVKNEENVQEYLTLVKKEMGDNYICPRTFRFGASSLLAVLKGTAAASTSSY